MKQFIEKIKNKKNLSFDESKAAFELLMEVKKTIEDHGYLTKSADYQMISKTTQKVSKSESDSVMKLLDTLDNNDDVQNIYTNLNLVNN